MATLDDLKPSEIEVREYPLERILASRTINGATYYLAKWEGYQNEDCTWEPRENFNDETLAEWQLQWANGDHLDEAEVAEVEAKMKAYKIQKKAKKAKRAKRANRAKKAKKARHLSSEDSPSDNDNILDSTIDSAVRRVPSSQHTSTERQKSSTRSDEFSVEQHQLQTTTQATTQQTSGKLSTQASLSRIPTFGSKKGIASRIPKQGSGKVLLINTKRDHFDIGDRFHTLRHMNNYQKHARREATPDISKLELRAPIEFELPKVKDDQYQDKPLDACDESPLFVPETSLEQTVNTGADNDLLHAPSAHLAGVTCPQAPSTPPVLATTVVRNIPPEHPTSRPTCPTMVLNTDRPTPMALTHGPQSPPREIVKDRADSSTRTQPPSSVPSIIAGRDELTSFQTSATDEVTENGPVAADVTPHSAESHSRTSVPEITKQKPNFSRTVSQPSTFISNIASIARRENATPSRRRSDAAESDAQPLSIPARVSSMPVRNGQNMKTATVRDGRSQQGEELVFILRYGSHSVGRLKVLRFPSWLVAKFVAAKQGHDVVIHFQEQCVMNKAKFVSFRTNVSFFFLFFPYIVGDTDSSTNITTSKLTTQIGLGLIQPYEDTESSTASLAEHLETQDVCAVWEFPGSTTPGFVVVLYSCRAPSWKFLGSIPVPGLVSRLHLLVRNENHDVNLATWVLSQDKDVNPRPVAAASLPTSSCRLPPLKAQAVATTRRDTEDSNLTVETSGTLVRARSPYFGERSPRSLRTPQSPGQPRQDSHDGMVSKSDTRAAAPAVSFSANFKDLGNMGDREVRKKKIFYIAFAKSHPAEARAVEEWLLVHDVRKRAIFLDDEKEAWSDFRTELSSKSGIVLFRRGSPVYYTMKNLASHLSRGLVGFNASLSGADECTDGGGGGGGGNVALNRIFTRGTVVFITESSLLDFPAEVLVMMKWFEKKGSGKVQTHKMGLVPDAREWILRRLLEPERGAKEKEAGEEEDDDEAEKSTQDQYLGILEVLQRLDTQAHANLDAATKDDPDWWLAAEEPGEEHGFMVSVPCDLPGYNDDDDDDRGDHNPDHDQPDGADDTEPPPPRRPLSMAASRVQARDEILVQYFVGWAAMHVEHYRDFSLVDEEWTNDNVKNSCHIYFCTPAKFVEMIDKSEKQAPSRKGPSG